MEWHTQLRRSSGSAATATRVAGHANASHSARGSFSSGGRTPTRRRASKNETERSSGAATAAGRRADRPAARPQTVGWRGSAATGAHSSPTLLPIHEPRQRASDAATLSTKEASFSIDACITAADASNDSMAPPEFAESDQARRPSEQLRDSRGRSESEDIATLDVADPEVAVEAGTPVRPQELSRSNSAADDSAPMHPLSPITPSWGPRVGGRGDVGADVLAAGAAAGASGGDETVCRDVGSGLAPTPQPHLPAKARVDALLDKLSHLTSYMAATMEETPSSGAPAPPCTSSSSREEVARRIQNTSAVPRLDCAGIRPGNAAQERAGERLRKEPVQESGANRDNGHIAKKDLALELDDEDEDEDEEEVIGGGGAPGNLECDLLTATFSRSSVLGMVCQETPVYFTEQAALHGGSEAGTSMATTPTTTPGLTPRIFRVLGSVAGSASVPAAEPIAESDEMWEEHRHGASAEQLGTRLEAREKELSQMHEAMEALLRQNQRLAMRNSEAQAESEIAHARAERANAAWAEVSAEVMHQRALAEYSRKAVLIHEHLSRLESERTGAERVVLECERIRADKAAREAVEAKEAALDVLESRQARWLHLRVSPVPAESQSPRTSPIWAAPGSRHGSLSLPPARRDGSVARSDAGHVVLSPRRVLVAPSLVAPPQFAVGSRIVSPSPPRPTRVVGMASPAAASSASLRVHSTSQPLARVESMAATTVEVARGSQSPPPCLSPPRCCRSPAWSRPREAVGLLPCAVGTTTAPITAPAAVAVQPPATPCALSWSPPHPASGARGAGTPRQGTFSPRLPSPCQGLQAVSPQPGQRSPSPPVVQHVPPPVPAVAIRASPAQQAPVVCARGPRLQQESAAAPTGLADPGSHRGATIPRSASTPLAAAPVVVTGPLSARGVCPATRDGGVQSRASSPSVRVVAVSPTKRRTIARRPGTSRNSFGARATPAVPTASTSCPRTPRLTWQAPTVAFVAPSSARSPSRRTG